MLKINLYLKYDYIIVWYNPNKDKYYFKKIKYGYAKYYEGFENSYGHKVILVITLYDVFYKMPLKELLIRRAIAFLERLNRKG